MSIEAFLQHQCRGGGFLAVSQFKCVSSAREFGPSSTVASSCCCCCCNRERDEWNVMLWRYQLRYSLKGSEASRTEGHVD